MPSPGAFSVEAKLSLDQVNGLVNYWWRKSPAYMGPPVDVLLHALLSLRDLPPEQKAAWAAIFEHSAVGLFRG